MFNRKKSLCGNVSILYDDIVKKMLIRELRKDVIDVTYTWCSENDVLSFQDTPSPIYYN